MHTQVDYECGDPLYIVKAWCTKYQDTHIPCGSNPIERSVYIINVTGLHSVANLICVERSRTKIAVRRSI